jgi:hypothetical protein
VANGARHVDERAGERMFVPKRGKQSMVVPTGDMASVTIISRSTPFAT